MLIAFAKYPSDDRVSQRERVKNFTRLFQALIGVRHELLAKNARQEPVDDVGKNNGSKPEDPRPHE